MTPESAEGPYRLGVLAMSQRKLDAAEKYLERALEIDPKQYAALDSLAGLYLYEKKNDKAIQRVQQQIQKDNSAATYGILGKVYTQLQQFKLAEAALKQALQLKPDDYNTYSLLGTLYANQKSFDQALSQYEQATKLNPKDSGVWTIYGMLNAESGRKDLAIRAYEKALELSPNSGGAANNLAWLLAASADECIAALFACKVRAFYNLEIRSLCSPLEGCETGLIGIHTDSIIF